MSLANLISQSLLDDLRHATEFLACVEATLDASIENGTHKDALDWVHSSAIALGKALINAKTAVDEVRHPEAPKSGELLAPIDSAAARREHRQLTRLMERAQRIELGRDKDAPTFGVPIEYGLEGIEGVAPAQEGAEQ